MAGSTAFGRAKRALQTVGNDVAKSDVVLTLLLVPETVPFAKVFDFDDPVRHENTNLSGIVARALKIGQIVDGGMSPTYETIH